MYTKRKTYSKLVNFKIFFSSDNRKKFKKYNTFSTVKKKKITEIPPLTCNKPFNRFYNELYFFMNTMGIINFY